MGVLTHARTLRPDRSTQDRDIDPQPPALAAAIIQRNGPTANIGRNKAGGAGQVASTSSNYGQGRVPQPISATDNHASQTKG
jgi:hypothetical protein